jgi:hypothetical protein
MTINKNEEEEDEKQALIALKLQVFNNRKTTSPSNVGSAVRMTNGGY